MPSNNALSERNERVKYARSLGIVKPHTMKKDVLEAAIADAEQAIAAERAEREKSKAGGDPFDPINPEIEGDHLTEDVLPETIGEAIATRDATREAWLMAAIDILRPTLKQAGCTTMNERVFAVSVGFPKGNVRKVIGQCWAAKASECGGTNHVFVSPVLSDAVQVLGVLVHEMIHADDDGESGHKGHFAACAKTVGLTGKMTATTVGEDLQPVLEDIVTELGPYPHVKLNIGSAVIKKQTTRMLKATCSLGSDCPVKDEKGNGLVLRMSRKWAEIGMPSCICGEEMKIEESGEGDE